MPAFSKLATFLCIFVVLAAFAVNAKVFFHESFDDMSKWTTSGKKADYGKLEATAGDFSGDAAINKGAKTMEDARFYASSTTFAGVTNDGKDLVVSLSVKNEQGLDCGGGYVKIGPKVDQAAFDGDTKYWLMFGPDKCGASNKVHTIFNYNGKNLLWKKEPRFPDDKLTHVYTLIVHPDNSYEVQIDQEKKESGKLDEDWDFLEPKEIDDVEDKKPGDWVDEAQIDDPEDKKPEDWDNEAEQITDPEAKMPDDWDESEDGKWEAPMIPNPKYKGAWSAKKIPNPTYKGVWAPKKVANPAYKADENLYKIPEPLEFVGIDVWQVKAGSIFDNIVIGDDIAEVNKIIDETWGATKEAEKKALEAKEAAAKPAETKEDAPKADEEEKEDL